MKKPETFSEQKQLRIGSGFLFPEIGAHKLLKWYFKHAPARTAKARQARSSRIISASNTTRSR